MQLHHINIKASKDLLEQEKEFFCSVLGFQEGFRPNFSSQGYWLYAENQPIVHLSVSDNHVKHETPGVFDHVAFISTGLKPFVELLQQKELAHSVNYLAQTNMSQVFLTSSLGVGIEVTFNDEKL